MVTQTVTAVLVLAVLSLFARIDILLAQTTTVEDVAATYGSVGDLIYTQIMGFAAFAAASQTNFKGLKMLVDCHAAYMDTLSEIASSELEDLNTCIGEQLEANSGLVLTMEQMDEVIYALLDETTLTDDESSAATSFFENFMISVVMCIQADAPVTPVGDPFCEDALKATCPLDVQTFWEDKYYCPAARKVDKWLAIAETEVATTKQAFDAFIASGSEYLQKEQEMNDAISEFEDAKADRKSAVGSDAKNAAQDILDEKKAAKEAAKAAFLALKEDRNELQAAYRAAKAKRMQLEEMKNWIAVCTANSEAEGCPGVCAIELA